MVDFLFHDAGFSAMVVNVWPVSDKAKAFFADQFGSAAVSAELRKSGGYELMEEIDRQGMTYRVEGLHHA